MSPRLASTRGADRDSWGLHRGLEPPDTTAKRQRACAVAWLGFHCLMGSNPGRVIKSSLVQRYEGPESGSCASLAIEARVPVRRQLDTKVWHDHIADQTVADAICDRVEVVMGRAKNGEAINSSPPSAWGVGDVDLLPAFVR